MRRAGHSRDHGRNDARCERLSRLACLRLGMRRASIAASGCWRRTRSGARSPRGSTVRAAPCRVPGVTIGTARYARSRLAARSAQCSCPLGLIGMLVMIGTVERCFAPRMRRCCSVGRVEMSWDEAARAAGGPKGSSDVLLPRRQPDQAGNPAARAGRPAWRFRATTSACSEGRPPAVTSCCGGCSNAEFGRVPFWSTFRRIS